MSTLLQIALGSTKANFVWNPYDGTSYNVRNDWSERKFGFDWVKKKINLKYINEKSIHADRNLSLSRSQSANLYTTETADLVSLFIEICWELLWNITNIEIN